MESSKKDKQETESANKPHLHLVGGKDAPQQQPMSSQSPDQTPDKTRGYIPGQPSASDREQAEGEEETIDEALKNQPTDEVQGQDQNKKGGHSAA